MKEVVIREIQDNKIVREHSHFCDRLTCVFTTPKRQPNNNVEYRVECVVEAPPSPNIDLESHICLTELTTQIEGLYRNKPEVAIRVAKDLVKGLNEWIESTEKEEPVKS